VFRLLLPFFLACCPALALNKRDTAFAWLVAGQAYYDLGQSFEIGSGVKQSMSDALENYHLAAQKNHAAAQFRLGELFETGTLVEKDLEKAFDFYQQAAANNHLVAKNRLGVMYFEGRGTQQNAQKAIAIFAEVLRESEAAQRNFDPNSKNDFIVPTTRDLKKMTTRKRRKLNHT